jgi:hypothetical protein
MKSNDAIASLLGRLVNWKFDQVIQYVNKLPKDTITKEDEELLEALSRMIGNSGWADSGDLGIIVSRAIQPLHDKLWKLL